MKALDSVDYALFGRPCFGERVSGDTAIIEEREGLVFMAIVDVLGHGPEAHIVARKIEDFLGQNWSSDLVATLRQLHEELKGTRGAAASLSVLDIDAGELSYLGVGNTVLRVFGRRSIRLHSTDGIIGSNIRQPVEQKLHLSRTDVVLLYTDGIKDRFELDDYPQLLYESAHCIARNLVRRFEKVYDDATCIVFRYKK